MKCPGCGGPLNEVSIAGFDRSFRCYTCGGFWTQSWVVNRMSPRSMDRWMPVIVDADLLKMGTMVCPTDLTPLTRFTGESMPTNLPVEKCDKCGWWWWPEDTLFRYKPAQEAKINYFKLWGKAADATALILPVMSVVLLIVGAAIGVGLVKVRQESSINASGYARAFFATYLGNGREFISFQSMQKIDSVEYQAKGLAYWTKMNVSSENGVYTLEIKNLKEGERYSVRILGKEFEFVAR